MTSPLHSLACAALLAILSGTAPAQSPSADASALVGTWSGTWTETGPRRLSGRYSMTIEKVQDERISGLAEMAGRRVPVPPFRLTGTLAGDRLVYGKRVRTELKIEGKRMSGGTSGANDDVVIELTKEK